MTVRLPLNGTSPPTRTMEHTLAGKDEVLYLSLPERLALEIVTEAPPAFGVATQPDNVAFTLPVSLVTPPVPDGVRAGLKETEPLSPVQ